MTATKVTTRNPFYKQARKAGKSHAAAMTHARKFRANANRKRKK